MNPKLLEALDEVETVLKKHDLTGLVIVGNNTHVDWRMRVEASWSCAKVEPLADGTNILRVKAKREDFPNVEAHKRCLESTVGTFVSFQHTLTAIDEQLSKVLLMLSKSINFTGKSTRET